MVNPSYNGSFKFPSSTRSTGARKSSLFTGRQSARIFNFNKRNRMPGEDENCEGILECWNSFFNQCMPAAC
jgi:hypothetical protein